jgi:hypothetical protein
MTDWAQQIELWREIAPLKTFPPAGKESFDAARAQVNGLPAALQEFYGTTNGLVAGSFIVLPLEDPTDIRRTWDSIQRANDPKATKFLAQSAELLGRFIVFADIGVGQAAAFDRTDGSIWYEEDGKMRQTDLSLDAFVGTVLREISERQ